MDHDANFVGDRLRLATFLRIVELEMPQRPSRFKRRLEPVDIENHKSDHLGSTHVESPTVEARTYGETPGPTSTAPKSPRRESVQEPTHYQNTNTILEDREATPRSPMPTGSVFNISRSPTSVNPCLGFEDSTSVQDKHGLVAKATNKGVKRQSGSAQVLKVEKAYCKATGFTNTRKRRLPVNGLALLRTTTTDGLPEPSDAGKVFATPIEVIDPIRDSQTVLSRNSTARCHNLKIDSHSGREERATYHLTQQLRTGTGTSQPVGRLRDSKLNLRKLPAQSVPRLGAHVGLNSIADGFEAQEFVITQTRKSPRRKKNLAREPKATLMMPVLELSNGLLPPPAIHDSIYLPTRTQTKVDLSCTETATRPGQLTLTKPESASKPEHTEKRDAQRLETIVRNQLSCITAPVRHDTESSDSDAIPEHHGNDDEENDYSDGTDDTTHSFHFGSPTRRPTLVDDTSYFEAAMHHLETGREEERAEGVSWSYQNAWV